MSFRMEKINAEVQKTLSEIINDDLRNPLLDDCVLTVCQVKVSPDFSSARVFISALNTNESHETIIKELSKSSSFIKKRLAEKQNFKRTPNLTFIYDDSLEQGERIKKLIEGLNK